MSINIGIARSIAVMLLVSLLAATAQAQDESIDDIGPAVDTSAIESESAAAGEDEAAPAANTPEPDITRSSSGNRVMDSIELSRTEITGNQELPKVLYIVPWQKANPGDMSGRPINSLLDEVLAPIDREEFIRQVNYYEDLHGNEEE